MRNCSAVIAAGIAWALPSRVVFRDCRRGKYKAGHAESHTFSHPQKDKGKIIMNKVKPSHLPLKANHGV